MSSELKYLSGFGGHFSSEALPGALPDGQNNPQKCPYGCYAEQLSGTAFTAPRHCNLRTWLYRIKPSVIQSAQTAIDSSRLANSADMEITPDQLRWSPFEENNEQSRDFQQGLVTLGGVGEPEMKSGLRIHIYFANADMAKKAMQNSDGDFLIVPQQGTMRVTTELGVFEVEPQEIIVIPRGFRFSVSLCGGSSQPLRGYILEVFNGHFELPNLGPIGANGLANPRDFLVPTASFSREDSEWVVVNKYMGRLFQATQSCTPFNVVAWHGNYVPFKYDLRKFCTMNSVSFDHPDPSIYTVLTCPSDSPGTAVADFVIFPPRWMVMENSFRPPYFHRNCMAEFMGMVYGKYDAKKGFMPGGASLHSCMTPHGPDAPTFEGASNKELAPEYFDGGLAFMFETCFQLKVSRWALGHKSRDQGYIDCWKGLQDHFSTSL